MEILKKIRENILLLLVPAVGYASSYFYLLGKYNFYKIPHDLIQISIETLVVSTFFAISIPLIILCIAYLLDIIVSLNFRLFTRINPLITKIAFIILFEIIALYELKTPFAIHIIGVLIISLGLSFIVPFSTLTDNYLIGTKTNIFVNIQNKKISLVKIVSLLFKKFWWMILMVFVVYYIVSSAFIGNSEYKRDETFWIYEDNSQEYIYVGNINNQFIFVKLDAKNMTTTNEILIKSNNDNIKMHREKIGVINK